MTGIVDVLCCGDLQTCQTPEKCRASGKCARFLDWPQIHPLREADPQRDEAPPRERVAQVIRLSTITTLDIEPEQVLQGALAADLKCVAIVGYRQDGSEFFASSVADGADVLWLFERAKLQLLSGGVESDA